jgi:hypothetical protein
VNITVCAACLCASCRDGFFYCDQFKTAGTIEMALDELLALRREHPSYLQPRVDAAEMGRRGGSRTSAVKAAVARANGAKGGRPKKTAQAT